MTRESTGEQQRWNSERVKLVAAAVAEKLNYRNSSSYTGEQQPDGSIRVRFPDGDVVVTFEWKEA